MQNLIPSNALLVFADVVDSSKFSAILGYEAYAERIIEFQNIFKSLGYLYFPKPADEATHYTLVDSRGDEGIVFVVEPNPDGAELIFRAIKFLFHLKGVLEFAIHKPGEEESAPTHIGLGAGIHFGRVAARSCIKPDGHSVVNQIEGYAINRAKRIESSSRVGKYSRIFLSKEAAMLLGDQPVILSPHNVSMRGIEESAEVYEVQAGLFAGLKLNSDIPENEFLKNFIFELVKKASGNPNPWIKSFLLSLLDCLADASRAIPPRASEYHTQQLKLAWQRVAEDDPILLFLRAKEFETKKEYTQQIRYLRDLLQRFPEFVHAKKNLIRVCWAIVNSKRELAEKVFARDLAKEFLEHFPHMLDEKDKKDFTDIINKARPKRSARKKRKV